MTNEGLKFGALALGIALVILIIVLIVRGHKDKFSNNHVSGKDPAGHCCPDNSNKNCKASDACRLAQKKYCPEKNFTDCTGAFGKRGKKLCTWCSSKGPSCPNNAGIVAC